MNDVNPENSDLESIAYFDQVHTASIEFFLSLAQEETKNHEVLEDDKENLWNAVRQCYERKDWERLIAFREALHYFFDLRGYWAYSLTLSKWTDEAAKAQDDRFNQARWLHDRADILNQQGNYHEAELLYQQSEATYRSLSQDEWALKSRHMRSMVVRAQGRTKEAQHLCQTTIDEARALGLNQWLAHPLYVLALLVRDEGNIQQAEAFVEESLALLAGTNEDAMIGQCHYFLGEIALQQHNFVKGRIHAEESLLFVQQARIKRRIIATQRLLGDLALAEGRYEEAATIYDGILGALEDAQFDDKPAKAQTLFSKAKLMVHMHKSQEAMFMLEGAVAIYKEVGNTRRIAATSLLLIQVYIQQRRWLQALQLVLSTFRMAFSSGLLHPHILRMLLRLRSR